MGTYGIVDASKDTTVAGRALLTREEEPVSVGTNELQLSLAALAFMPGDVAAKIDDVTFASEEGDKFYYRKARSLDVTPETGLEITTTAGDRLTWDADNGGEIVVTLVDGTSWTKDDACTSCTAMNVYASPAVIEGVKKFEEATEAEGRRLGAQKNHGINFLDICKRGVHGLDDTDTYDCLHTKLMTMNGEPAAKHMINSVECDGGNFGYVTSLSQDGMATQTLQMEILLLNHCFFHGMGAADKGFSKPCPNDRIDSDSRGDGNVKVIYSMTGIGSFAGTGKSIEFVSDHTLVHDDQDGDTDYHGDGEMYSIDVTRATMENPNTMTCTVKGDGIVCDWRINEVGQATKAHAGCVVNLSCTAWSS